MIRGNCLECRRPSRKCSILNKEYIELAILQMDCKLDIGKCSEVISLMFLGVVVKNTDFP